MAFLPPSSMESRSAGQPAWAATFFPLAVEPVNMR